MSNELKQGSVISPYIFNVYLDERSCKLSQSHKGFHNGDAAMKHFTIADNLAMMALMAMALNMLLDIYQHFATEHFFLYSVSKLVGTVIPSKGVKWQSPPNIYLNGVAFEYLEGIKYLGHIIKKSYLTEDDGTLREVRALSVKDNNPI